MTPRQAQLLAFLRQREIGGGVCPTFQEIADHLGVKSKSGISRLVAALEGFGVITRKPNGERAIHVVGLSEYARGYYDGYAAAQAKRSAAWPLSSHPASRQTVRAPAIKRRGAA